jgi:type II secretory pathway pseudopilin PulG
VSKVDDISEPELVKVTPPLFINLIAKNTLPKKYIKYQTKTSLIAQGQSAVTAAVEDCKKRVWDADVKKCKDELAPKISEVQQQCESEAKLQQANSEALQRAMNFMMVAMMCKKKQDMMCAMAMMQMMQQAMAQAQAAKASFEEDQRRRELQALIDQYNNTEVATVETPTNPSTPPNTNNPGITTNPNGGIDPAGVATDVSGQTGTAESVLGATTSPGTGTGTNGNSPKESTNGLQITPELSAAIGSAKESELRKAMDNGSLYGSLANGVVPGGSAKSSADIKGAQLASVKSAVEDAPKAGGLLGPLFGAGASQKDSGSTAVNTSALVAAKLKSSAMDRLPASFQDAATPGLGELARRVSAQTRSYARNYNLTVIK